MTATSVNPSTAGDLAQTAPDILVKDPLSAEARRALAWWPADLARDGAVWLLQPDTPSQDVSLPNSGDQEHGLGAADLSEPKSLALGTASEPVRLLAPKLLAAPQLRPLEGRSGDQPTLQTNLLAPALSDLGSGSAGPVSIASDVAAQEAPQLALSAPSANAVATITPSTTPVEVGARFQVNTITQGNQEGASVAALADGRFVVTWHDESLGWEVGPRVRAQIFESSGSKLGGEFLVNSVEGQFAYAPSILTLPNGRFVIAYDSTGNGNRSFQIFDSDGTKYGSEIALFGTGHDNRIMSNLTDGRFVMVSSVDRGSFGEIRAQVLTSNGQTSGPEVIVNATTTNGTFVAYASVAGLPGGGFVVAWRDMGDGSGEYLRKI